MPAASSGTAAEGSVETRYNTKALTIIDRVGTRVALIRTPVARSRRFVICYNPEQADRDAHLREVMTTKLGALIAGTDALSATKRAEPCGRISTMAGLHRLRVTGGGLLRVDKAKVKAETNPSSSCRSNAAGET